MRRRRDPLAGSQGGPPPRDGPRDEQRRPGSGARMQHRGNDGVSSLQPAGTLLPRCRNDETSCLRFGAALWDLRTSVSGGSTGLSRGCLLVSLLRSSLPGGRRPRSSASRRFSIYDFLMQANRLTASPPRMFSEESSAASNTPVAALPLKSDCRERLRRGVAFHRDWSTSNRRVNWLGSFPTADVPHR